MSKTAKLMILIGLCLACVGAAFSSFNLKTLTKPFYNEDNYTKKEYIISYNEIDSLFVTTSNENIKIIPADDNQITVSYYENDVFSYKISSSDRTFHITKNGKIKWQLFSFNFNVFEPSITIEIPRETLLSLNIKTSNSKIEVEDLRFGEGDFKTSNSGIILRNVVANYLDLKTSNGKVSIADTNAHSLKVTTSNSPIICDLVKTDSLDLKTSNSDIRLNKSESATIDLKTSNGDIDASIIGHKDNYRQEFVTSLGEVTVEGYTYGKRFFDNENQTSYIKAKTSNADIDINFDNR